MVWIKFKGLQPSSKISTCTMYMCGCVLCCLYNLQTIYKHFQVSKLFELCIWQRLLYGYESLICKIHHFVSKNLKDFEKSPGVNIIFYCNFFMFSFEHSCEHSVCSQPALRTTRSTTETTRNDNLKLNRNLCMRSSRAPKTEMTS